MRDKVTAVENILSNKTEGAEKKDANSNHPTKEEAEAARRTKRKTGKASAVEDNNKDNNPTGIESTLQSQPVNTAALIPGSKAAEKS